MAEPPAKRARRVDSSTMWDLNDRATQSPEPNLRREPYPREDGRHDGPRDDRRYRSRSRDQKDRRRDRSRSRDRRDRDRDRRDRDRDGRGPRDRERSISRERYYDRRGKLFAAAPFAILLSLRVSDIFFFLGYPSKSDRRSRSPARKGTRDRSRTPPSRGPRSDRRYDRKDPHSRSMGTPDSQRAPKDEMDMDIDAEGTEGDDIDNLMRKYMGFSRFRSTKNTQVPGNDIYGVRKEKKTQYRQYMNRTGGFNRPLSP